MSQANLLDMAKLNGDDKLVGLIEENLTLAPELEMFPMRTIKGTSYKTLVRKTFPWLGFRWVNTGFFRGKSTFINRTVETFLFGGAIQVDKAVAMAHEEGQAAFEMLEASGITKNAMIKLGAQIWYGVGSDPKGFTGIKSLLPKGGEVVVDAMGTTANTASSVYAVKFGVRDCILVCGQSGNLILEPFRDEQLPDPEDPDKFIPSRVSDLNAWMGMQVGNRKCVGRILDLTADTGKGLTDNLLAELLSLFPVGIVPDALFMSRRSRRQLQCSRTVVINAGGDGEPSGGDSNIAPVPTDYEGTPIYATDSILDIDAIE